MARTTIKIQYTLPFQQVDGNIKTILSQEGYKEINRNNELVWKKGTGLLTAMQYIKVEYGNDCVNISGWIQSGIGNIGGKEMDLNGVFGAMPKKSVLKVISKIQNAVR